MKSAGFLMILGSLCLSGLFFLPLWNIELGAPQYPDPLGLDIYINGIQGQNEFDVQNIDGLNHYIGMKTLPKPEDMWEFSVFPKVVLAMVILGVLIGILVMAKKLGHMWIMIWFVVMAILGALGIYDFNLWLTDYGTNLDPNAILKLQNPDGTPMSYKPPLIGHKQLLNFDAYSYPHSGGYLMGVGMLIVFISFFIGRKKSLSLKSMAILLLPLLALSCSAKQEPIMYGEQDCVYCQMTIVDKIHGAEIVTKKGKVFTYDAVECMVNDLKERDENEIAYFLVNHYNTPEELVDATHATYLKSENLPSPMGGYLTAFADAESAEKALAEYGGKLVSWEQLKSIYHD